MTEILKISAGVFIGEIGIALIGGFLATWGATRKRSAALKKLSELERLMTEKAKGSVG
jgi:hypothetical protein